MNNLLAKYKKVLESHLLIFLVGFLVEVGLVLAIHCVVGDKVTSGIGRLMSGQPNVVDVVVEVVFVVKLMRL